MMNVSVKKWINLMLTLLLHGTTRWRIQKLTKVAGQLSPFHPYHSSSVEWGKKAI